MNVNLSSTIKLNPDYVVRLEYFGGILYDKKSMKYYGLNRTVADILYLAQYSPVIKDIVDFLCEAHGLNFSESKATVLDFLNSLLKDDIINVIKDDGPLINMSVVLNSLKQARGFVDKLNYLSAPLTAFLHLTWGCNLRCKYCFLNAPRKTLRKPLTLSEFRRIIDELSEMKTFELCITGGEPLLHPRFLDIVEHAYAKGLALNVTTNGLLLNGHLARTLAGYNVNVQIPLQGSTPKIHEELTGIRGSFNGALRAIRLLNSYKANVSVITVLQKANREDVFEMPQLLADLGVRVWNIVELKPIGRADKSMVISLKERLKILSKLEEEARRLGIRIIAERPFFFVGDDEISQTIRSNEFYKLFTRCGVRAGRYVEITPDGFVYPCDLLLGATFPRLIAGDLRRNTFKEIWHSSEILNKFRNLQQKNMHGKCTSCEYFELCGGKCRALAYVYYGDLYGPDPRCPR
ncbi:radical SAM protein [Thermococcus sp.]